MMFYSQCYPTPISDPLLQLAHDVGLRVPYGSGKRLLENEVKDADSIARAIEQGPTAHCGDFSFLFVHDMPDKYKWTIWGLENFLGSARHAIVEVDVDGTLKTYDPTLGIVYPCSVSALLDGRCEYGSEILTRAVAPKFASYRSIYFFYKAKVVSKSSDMDALVRAYQSRRS